MNTRTPISQGERATDFVLPTPDGTPTRFYAHAGGRLTVIFFTQTITEAVSSSIAVLENLDAKPDIFIVQTTSNVTDTNPHVFIDQGQQVHQAYRINSTDAPTALVLNPNLRVLSTHILQNQNTCDEIIHTLAQQTPPTPQDITTQAPVLLIPNVLTSDMCQALINVWQTQGNEETGVEKSVAQHRQNRIDHTNKKRRDHIVTDEKLMRLISTTVGRRVMPELKKAFHFEATRFEGFKIVCYDAKDQGFFHAHRDNLSPSTAHRRFALTLNLNTGYEGGHLTFPEYGHHRYKPDAGGALIFSSTHLHEVTPVTQGQRFTLLSFLFGENDIRQT